MQTLKNGGIAWKLKRSYTYAPKYALTLPFLKMSLGFGILWDHLRYVLSHTRLGNRFSVKHCQFRRVKIVVGNVLQPLSGRCCVGVSFFPSLFLLLTQKH